MTTFPITLPTVTGIKSLVTRKQFTVARSQSLFTGVEQVQIHPGQWFEFEAELPPMVKADADVWDAFFTLLGGSAKTFLMGDPMATQPEGSAADTPGTPELDGDHSVRATTVNLKGLPANATNYLKAGDYFQLGTGASARLHKFLTNVSSNGAGEASGEIFPMLRTDYPDSETVILNNTVGLFRLVTNSVQWSVNQDIYFGSFGCKEAL